MRPAQLNVARDLQSPAALGVLSEPPIKGLFVPRLVSMLPTAPVDGDEVYYVADDAGGVVWHLRYRAASPNTQKWEAVSAPPLTAYIATADGMGATAGAWADLGLTPGPAVTVPLAGRYILSVSCQTNSVGGVAAVSYIGAAIVAGGAGGGTPAHQAGVSVPAAYQASLSRITPEAVTAGQDVRMRYQQSVGNTFTWSERFLSVQPIYVG